MYGFCFKAKASCVLELYHIAQIITVKLQGNVDSRPETDFTALV